jgi:hypothetical protein
VAPAKDSTGDYHIDACAAFRIDPLSQYGFIDHEFSRGLLAK